MHRTQTGRLRPTRKDKEKRVRVKVKVKKVKHSRAKDRARILKVRSTFCANSLKKERSVPLEGRPACTLITRNGFKRKLIQPMLKRHQEPLELLLRVSRWLM
jgi:hypothetical protein